MSQPGKSYERVHYEFRPAKQVERRMLVHTFQGLMQAGFSISDYIYTGMGSIYFIDCIMFHKYLGIKKLLSVEISTDIVKRVKFNRPFKCVDVKIGDIIEHIPRLSTDKKHILWLDFDNILSEDVLTATCMAAAHLSAGSVLLVTVDVEPPGRKEDGPSKWNSKFWMKHFITEAREYLWPNPTTREFAESRLLNVNAQLIDNAISKGLVGREEVSFYPLFNFTYADGNRMLSLGGMIGTEEDGRNLNSLDRKTLFFLKPSLTSIPYEIFVPKVTRKERLYLDSKMPCVDDWTPNSFELDWDKVRAYRDLYCYYPAYTEMLL